MVRLQLAPGLSDEFL